MFQNTDQEQLDEFTRRSKHYADLLKNGALMHDAIATAFAVDETVAMHFAFEAQSHALALLWANLQGWGN